MRAVKASYSAIITALDHIYSESHEPEALGIKKALFKKSTIAAIYLLDYVLLQVAKLSRALQTENLDLSMISCLLDATLHSIDDAVLSSSNWVLELLEAAQDLETAIEEQITQEDISTFQEKIGQCFIHQLRTTLQAVLPPQTWRVPSASLIQEKYLVLPPLCFFCTEKVLLTL